MRLNRRHFYTATTAAAATVAAGGSWWILRNEPIEGDTPTDSGTEPTVERIDMLAGAYVSEPHLAEPEMLVMLSLTGGNASDLSLELRFFDMEGNSLNDASAPTATLINLITGEETSDIEINQTDDSWTLEQSAISSDGWWQLHVEQESMTSSWTFHIPDPNILGVDAVPKQEADPDAEAMLAEAMKVLSSHVSLRWWQWLSSGAGAIVLSRFSVTTEASNGQPPSFESDSILSGLIPLGTQAGEKRFTAGGARTVSIGDTASRINAEGTPESVNPVQYLPIDQYHTTYEGYDQVHFGMTAEIDGRQCQLVAFHLFSGFDTWYAFWIDIDTHIIRELFMVTQMHYMHWVYFDVDEPFELTF